VLGRSNLALIFTIGTLIGKGDVWVESGNEIKAALSVADTMALPLLDLATTLEGLDEICHGDLASVDRRFETITSRFQLYVREGNLMGLIVAKLAGREDRYEEAKRLACSKVPNGHKAAPILKNWCRFLTVRPCRVE
jgi:hypothetical protein